MWFLYAILATICGGIYSFAHKVAAEKNYSSSKITMYNLFYGSLFAIIFIIFNFEGFDNLLLLCGFAIMNTIFYILTLITRIDALRVISTNIFYPFYRILGSLLALLVGFIFFNETISPIQGIGIILGMSVILLLLEKNGNTKQKNFKLGIFLLLIGTIFLTFATSINKIVANLGLGIYMYIFLANIFGTFNCYYLSQKEKKNKKNFNNKNIHLVGFLTGLVQIGSYAFSLLALKEGSLGIFTVIYSFSIVVPIVLSVFIYSEKMNLKKIIALILTIVSIYLLK